MDSLSISYGVETVLYFYTGIYREEDIETQNRVLQIGSSWDKWFIVEAHKLLVFICEKIVIKYAHNYLQGVKNQIIVQLEEKMTEKRREAESLLQGGYDLHAHSFPSHISRSVDDVELIQQAAAAKMAGVMIKNHYESTAARAALINKRRGFTARAYGGLVLNWPAGGINPYAAESALKLGASFIWLPTRDAANCLQFGDMPGDFFSRPGISVLDESGELVEEFYEVLEVVKKYDAVLATGHISVRESIAACRAAREYGVRTVLTHPEWMRTVVPVGVQMELAGLGVIIERNWANVSDGDCTAEQMVSHIRAVGTGRTFIATDRGQAWKEPPVEGMLRFIELLLEYGFTHEEIKTMVCEVPGQLVNGR